MTLTRTLTRLIDLLYVKPLRRIVPRKRSATPPAEA